MPSGALADRVSRRKVLIAAGAVRAVGFALWVAAPSYPSFAIGFVLWGLSSALRSGTFEALVYDELTAAGAVASYGRLIGTAGTIRLLANVGATLAAAPLVSFGGYALVGWVSAGVCVADAVVSWSFPERPRVERVDGGVRGYLRTLRDGLVEAHRNHAVQSVLIVLVWLGIGAFDEYLPLLVRGYGVPTDIVPLLMAATGVVTAGASWAAGRWSGARSGWPAAVLLAGSMALAIGALVEHPAGFVGLTAAFTAVTYVTVCAQVRLQHAISGDARATVTSVAGLGAECAALTTYGAIAGLSAWLSIAQCIAVMAVPMALLGLAVPRLLAARPQR